MKPLLLRQQLVAQLLAAPLQPLHQGLQALCDQGHGLGLCLQGVQHFVAPVGGREGAEQGGDLRVQQAHAAQGFLGGQPFANPPRGQHRARARM